MALRSLGAALILYGRVGTYEKRSASLKQGEPGDEHLWRACAESIASHVVEPWRRSGPLDVFVQSWNPELSAAMDAHWQPVASQHATQNGSLSCAGIKLNYCRRTRWALLGMRLALDMRAGWVVREAARGHAIGDHHTVVMMRHDLFWHSDLPVVRAGSATRLWLPYDCETREAAPAPRPRASRARHAPQPSSNGSFAILEPHREVLGRRCSAHEERRRRVNATLDWCANSVNIDWFFVADAEVATGFTETSTQFEKYAALIKRGLHFNNLAPHHFWGLYFFHTRRLRATCQLGNVAHAGLDFFLGRMIRQGSHCTFDALRRVWSPGGGAGGSCDADAIPGYTSNCAGMAPTPLQRRCTEMGALPRPTNASSRLPRHGAAAQGAREGQPGRRGQRHGGQGEEGNSSAVRPARLGRAEGSSKPRRSEVGLEQLRLQLADAKALIQQQADRIAELERSRRRSNRSGSWPGMLG